MGPDRVLGVFMPEADSDPMSLQLGQELAAKLGIATVIENIAPILAAAGCYERRDAFVRQVVPEFGPGWKFQARPAVPDRIRRLQHLVHGRALPRMAASRATAAR